MRRILIAVLLLTAGCSSPALPGSEPELDAQGVVGRLSQQVPAAQLRTVVTAETDTKRLMGRPGSYTSKAIWNDSRVPEQDPSMAAADEPRLGGVVEVFPDEATATARRELIEGFVRSSGGWISEYDYQAGPVLVRVSGQLPPAQAAEYERATAGLQR